MQDFEDDLAARNRIVGQIVLHLARAEYDQVAARAPRSRITRRCAVPEPIETNCSRATLLRARKCHRQALSGFGNCCLRAASGKDLKDDGTLMGMYPQHKEIPAATLDKLLERPGDEAWVDGLLFDASGETWVAPVDALGKLDLGKYSCWDGELPFVYLLTLAQSGIDAAKLHLLMPSIGTPTDRLEDEWATAFGSPVVIDSHVPKWGNPDKPCSGFASSVPCYGIFSYRTPATLRSVWQLLCEVCTRYPRQLSRLREHFGEEIAYYEACAARGSADLYVMW